MEVVRRFIFMLALLVVALGAKAAVHYVWMPGTPFDLSSLVPALVIVIIYALAAAALAAIVDKPTLAVMLILLAPIWPLDGTPDYWLGCAVAALCVGGYLLERDHPRSAALALTLTLPEPQIALAVFVAMLVLVPRSRVVLIVGFVVVKLASVTIFGFERYFAYFARAVPMNVDAMVSAPQSLPHVLAGLGAQPGAAATFGWAWFACSLLVGLFVAARAARIVDLPSVSLFVPVAAATLGSPDLSSAHAAAALPAAIALAPASWTARIAIALLVVRWNGALRLEMVPATAGGIGASFVAFDRDAIRERVGWLVFAPLLSLAGLALLARFDVRAQIEIALLWTALFLIFFVRARRPNPFRLSRRD